MGLSWNSYLNNLFIINLLLLSHFLFHLIPITCSLSHTQPLCHDNERSALLSFKASFITLKSASHNPSAYPKLALWNTNGGDCCLWDGVECDSHTGHVIGLDLSSSYLFGSINSTSQLFHLSQLHTLNLADNDFNFSHIPTSIGHFSRLIYLNLSASAFSGKIPFEILHLSKLSSLDLSFNTDPSSGKKLLKLNKPDLTSLVGNLSGLAHLDLSLVDINSKVPETIANLSSLRFLDLTDSGLHGEFPIEIFQLPKLEYLNVRFNQKLIGHLPEFNSTLPLKSLRLGETGFYGELPPSIANLHALTELRIRECNFSGSIPSSLGNLTKLEYLDLANNSFHGYIPSLQNLIRLRFLQLSYNPFKGRTLSTLSWIAKLPRLIFLDLIRTNLQGPIPSSFSNLTNLSTFRLAYNELNGSVPLWLLNLTQLTDLYLSSNNFTGTLELETFINHAYLTNLRLSHNNLSLVSKSNSNITQLHELRVLELASCNLNKFPDFLSLKNKLELLDLSYNKIGGKIPRLEYSSWSKIQVIDLRFNMLQGSLPIPPQTTTVYRVSNNEFSGEISPSICELHSLYALDLSSNNLSGQLPSCLGNFSDSLTILNLRNNNFHGPIPPISCIAKDKGSVRLIDLSSNQLQGPVPRSLANCKMLEYLHIGNNLILDMFPFWLGTLPQLKVLVLRDNEFYGSISDFEEPHSFPELRIIDLSYNHFSGGLPSNYFRYWNAMKIEDTSKLTYMQVNKSFDVHSYRVNRNFGFSVTLTNKGIQTIYSKIQELLCVIDLSSNEFEGEIPGLIGDLKGLRLLNLSNNNLVGQIPTSLGDLTKLEALDLSHNKLSGQIPKQLGKLNYLSFFDVSHNNLSGNVPQGGQFDTFPDIWFEDNFGLSRNGNSKAPVVPLPPLVVDNDGGSDHSLLSELLRWEIIVVGYGSGLVIGFVIGHFVTTKRLGLVLICLGMKKLQMLIEI